MLLNIHNYLVAVNPLKLLTLVPRNAGQQQPYNYIPLITFEAFSCKHYFINSGTIRGKAEGVSRWMESLEKSRGKSPWGRRLQGFWPRVFLRDSISPWYTQGFSTYFHSFCILSYNKGFFSANGLLRESIGHYTGLGQRILKELNLNILARDA